MTAPVGSWATQQLAEFLALLSSREDEAAATLSAVERAAEALEAEAGAVLRDGRVVASIGFPYGRAPEAELAEVVIGASDRIPVPGVGACLTTAAPLEGENGGWLVLARAEEFTRDEAHLVRGMARVLVMTTRLLERQRLLERLSEIQGSIVHRAELSAMLQAVTEGARDLLDEEVVALRLIDSQDASRMHVAAHVGLSADQLADVRDLPVGEGAAGRAIQEDRLVAIEDYENAADALPVLARSRLQAAMAAPVRRNGVVCGSLAVGSYEMGRRYSETERSVLLAFAEHASLAITDASNFEDALHRALHDALTGLPNRELFGQQLSTALEHAEPTNSLTAVLFLDLDGFKNVNDSLGHASGDELLVAVAERLKDSLRPQDSAARFGGDEFAVLLEDLHDVAAAELVASRVLEALRQPHTIAGHELRVTASLGIADTRGADADLLRNADLAMYRAKGRGKDCFERYEPEMHAAVVRRLALESDLQGALDDEQLCLHYQPVVDLQSGDVVGVEALVRWQHPERGLLPPDEFIPLAEDSHLIVALGQWALCRACRQAAEWQHLVPSLSVGVNLSSTQLARPTLCAEISRALDEARLDPTRLTLEITETVLMRDVDPTVGRLREIRDLGVQLALDDFGTGYSSLQYLGGFPVDILKIAKSFVDGVAGESALARAIVDLADAFQLQVIAEGVERPEQRDGLLDLGCRLGQGFLFAPPLEPEVLEPMLRAGTSLQPGAMPA